MNQKFDLHCHSVFSDGTSNISEIEEFCLKTKLAISLTDHNEIRGSIKLFENNRIISIPGIEIISQEGIEILIYFKEIYEMEEFYKKQIEPYKGRCVISCLKNSLFDILNHAVEINTFISLPHPFGIIQNYELHKIRSKSPTLFTKLFKILDAIEVYNGHISKPQAEKALNLSKEFKKKITAGSDAHELKYIGYTSISFEVKEKSFNNIFNTIKDNEYIDLKFIENKRRYLSISKFYKRNLVDYIKSFF